MPRRPSDILSDLEDLRLRIEALERFRFREPLHLVGGSGEPAFENSWINYGGAEQVASFYKWGDRVYLAGMVTGGTVPATIFTLPVGYRPSGPARRTILAANTPVYGMVDAAGAVSIQTGSNAWVDLAGIDFKWGFT